MITLLSTTWATILAVILLVTVAEGVIVIAILVVLEIRILTVVGVLCHRQILGHMDIVTVVTTRSRTLPINEPLDFPTVPLR